MVLIEIPKEYGYVIISGVASIFLTTYLGFQVGSARRKAGVPYPNLYASKEEAEKDRNKLVFNCYQRAHQSTFEHYPQFLLTLMIGGLKHPVLSAVGGGIWVLGRLVFAWGYQTGDPAKRTRGTFAYIGSIVLLGTSISTAVSLLTQ
ncbi:25111_t:CDS:2 [Cetraspora pellucida]|uniref:Glutathione S-transferase 3, mitochondrial n=1 Tax=Cetraspora pellucida TaxID=1433469 RepID=A0A9N9AL65_9GLOM|nr:25111_t:CDS:2 [Cetraspora pellucida]